MDSDPKHDHDETQTSTTPSPMGKGVGAEGKQEGSQNQGRAEHFMEYPFGAGYRLRRFEVYNWGVFDGAVYALEPRGQTTLLVGENGSGKSTLLDALLTLLVRPQARNYNVAAGATKNERDERTYIRGAYDRTVGEDGRPQIQYLRHGTGHYTILLAVFGNESIGEALTVCQVLYLNSENGVERTYAYCTGERGIVRDLAHLESGSTLTKQLKERGFETTPSYNQFYLWLQRHTGLKAKAMDMFNQTVAVKDVQRLDTFIRQHMLEKQPWGERVATLLSHVGELSEAHRILVRIRRQNEFLLPIVQSGTQYRARIAEWNRLQAVVTATPFYFAQQTVALLEPLCAKWHQQLQFHDHEINRLDTLLDRFHQEIARLEIDIENKGGDRLKRLPGLIEQSQAMVRIKGETRSRYLGFLHGCGIKTPLTSPDQFHRVRSELTSRRAILVKDRDGLRKSASALQYRAVQMTHQLQADRAEIEALDRRQGNLSESLMMLREQLCSELRIPSSTMPFCAELLRVKAEECLWEPSIERVLYGFARSLLVPNEFYGRVASYVDATRLQDAVGRGQRLVYLRVAKREEALAGTNGKDTLASKLEYRDHPLTPWVKAEIAQRFDYTACDTIAEFTACRGPAMTSNRQIKTGNTRHEKDDRFAAHDRRSFVLGWDNREKRLAIRESIRELKREWEQIDARVQKAHAEVDQATRALLALDEAASYMNYDQIDAPRHEFEVSQLQLEKQRLEESNDVIQELQRRIAALRAEVAGYKQDRDLHLGARTRIDQELRNGTKLLESARRRRLEGMNSPNWESMAEQFKAIEGDLSSQLTIDNLSTLPEMTLRASRDSADAMGTRLKPLEKEVTTAMGKYLRAFPQDDLDLDPDIGSLDSFDALYQRISQEDLPRHEERFKNRLNEKVLHEIGILNSSLENDRQEIKDKVEQLNGALRLMEWKPGTFMQLEATDLPDREVQEFRRELAACLSSTLEGSSQTNETTFVRIETLVTKLRDPASERWREKVMDVRNWFNFAAREIVADTGQSRSYYEGGTGQSGGEKGKLAFLVLVAAVAYQFDLEPDGANPSRFHFVMVDEMFSRSDDAHAEYALDLFQRFGLQLLIVAPLDAKARVTEPYVGTYVHVVKNRETHRSELITITAEQLKEGLDGNRS